MSSRSYPLKELDVLMTEGQLKEAIKKSKAIVFDLHQVSSRIKKEPDKLDEIVFTSLTTKPGVYHN
ncbi:hypothetical protein EFU28_17625 [Vibrio cholerae]|uniref:hypothetical protein n=1 Tax=Vibrio cholerae TaxID=666 RepID=UPI001DC7D7B4|nr:hypothetical protein [Vibrio cholerae]